MQFSDGSPAWPLFQSIFGSIIQVVLVCCAGYILTLRGILDKATQGQLNALNVNFFTPCLLFSKVAFSLSADEFRELWIIPLFFILISGVSLVVAWILALVFRLNRPQKNFAMAAAMIMNSNSLPVALIQSLVVSVPGLAWGQDDTIDSMVGRALTYILLSGTMGQFIRWSYGVHLLSKAVIPDEVEHIVTLDDESSSSTESMERIEDLRCEDGRGDLVTWRAPHVTTVPEEAILIVHSNVDEYVPVPVWSRKNTLTQRAARAGGTIWRRVTNFMTPPLWASVASLVVALYQPLQLLLAAGDCSIPLTLVVLGAYFHRAPEKSRLPPSDDLESQRATPLSQLRKIFCLESEDQMGPIRLHANTSQLGNSGEGRMVFAIILARMFIVPLLLLPLVVLGARRGSPHVFKDPVFILSQVLLLASPPALTLAQISGATSDLFERWISRTVFWSYCLVTPPVTMGYALIAMLITRL
ncbi:auxin efflux carrier [Russula aff. rugulosa BPL654]|nr:auxin efflux carrier [Russula aff. rugulosa BPL654]